MLRRTLSTPLWALMGMVGVVLLIACANVAGLLIGRGTQRQTELALRMAIGAGRGRIVRQLFSESLLLAVLGGAVGLLLGVWAARLLAGFISTPEGPLNLSRSLDWPMLGFSLATTAIATLLFGVGPAILATRISLFPALKQSGTAGAAGGRLRRVLVTAQVSLSLLLLTGAALFMQSLRNLRALDPGFATSNVIAFSVDPTLNGYPREKAEEAYRRLKQRYLSYTRTGFADGLGCTEC